MTFYDFYLKKIDIIGSIELDFSDFYFKNDRYILNNIALFSSIKKEGLETEALSLCLWILIAACLLLLGLQDTSIPLQTWL